MILAWIGQLGSILTVSVLVYLVGEPEKLAVAKSLALVGEISLVGAVTRALKRQVDWRSVEWFGIPGGVGPYLGAALSVYLAGSAQLLLFAVIMLLAAALMFRPARVHDLGIHRHRRSGQLVGDAYGPPTPA